MSTATVRVTASTRDQLRELAERLDKSMQAVLAEAVEAYRQRSLPKLNADSESDELSEDPNVLAFKALDTDFVRRNAGKWAASCRGKLVALSADKTELFGILARKHPDEPCLVRELALGEPRVVRFRRPRRIIRAENRGPVRHPAAPS